MKKTSKSWSKNWMVYGLAPAFLAGVTALVYYPSLYYDFQFDDVANIKKFFAARTHTFSMWAFKSPRWISYWLNCVNYQIGKHNPFVYRTFNVSFHIITGVLLFFVTYTAFSRLKKESYFGKRALSISFITALLFLLHPVQTQTVSYVIQGQLEGLAGMFTMLLALLFLHWTTLKNTALKVICAFGMYAILFVACGTKEIILVSPLTLLLLDWFFVAQGDWKQIRSRALFYAGYAGIMFYFFRFYIQGAKNGRLIKEYLFKIDNKITSNIGNVITQHAGQEITRWSYCISQFKVILHYLWIFIWPFSISVDYDWKLAPNFFTPEVLIPLLGLLIIGAGIATLLYKDKTNVLAFGALWFFVGIAPRSSIIPSTELVADYKTYFSSYGWLLLLAIGLIYCFEWLTEQIKQFNVPQAFHSPQLAIALCALCLGWSTYERNKVWRSPQEFWYNIVQNAPLKARAYNNYAVSLAEQKKFKEAVPYLRKAIKMDAHYPDPWNNIAVCYNALQKTDLAINQLYEAIKINPTYPEFYNNLASFLLVKKEYNKVCSMAQKAISLRGYYGKAHFNWGRALYELGDKEKAFEKIKFACRTGDYDTIEGFDTYAKLALELEKFEDAIVGYRQLYALNPSNKDAQFSWANALYCNKNHKQAKQIYMAMVQENPQEYRCWYNLAETHLDLGNKAEAIKCFEQAAPLQQHFPHVGQRIAEITGKKLPSGPVQA
ncbi:MAG: tetratricopeptide (TPR) repeat protein [Alteromonas naphthalenivorans]|jgi:tetratricopeptide (TPR) repeat protein